LGDKIKAGYEIIPLSNYYVKDVERLVTSSWGSFKIAVHRELYDLRELLGFIAISDEQKIIGYCYYHVCNNECEIMVLESLRSGIGASTALIESVIKLARDKNCTRVHLRTSNDNAHAFRFYQRRGFTMCAVGWNYMDRARKLKPEIPMIGDDEIPLLHEIEFELIL